MLSGGKGQLYGNGYTCFFMSGWKFYIDTVGVTQLMIWHGFFSSLPWQDLVPDQDHTVVTAGLGTLGTLQTRVSKSDFCTASRTPDGSFVVAYMPTAREITVNMGSLKAPASAKWFDPTNGAYTTIPGGPSRTPERGSSRRPATARRRRQRLGPATGCVTFRSVALCLQPPEETRGPRWAFGHDALEPTRSVSRVPVQVLETRRRNPMRSASRQRVP